MNAGSDSRSGPTKPAPRRYFFRKSVYRIRTAVNRTRFALGIGQSLHRNRPGGRILIYHGIDRVGSTRFNSRFISQATFARQVRYFAENFHCVSLEQYFAGERASDRLTVSLTFDDGYLNNLELALPVLEEFNVPATFFVTAVRALGKDHLWPDWLDLGTELIEDSVKFSGCTYTKNRHGQLASGKTTLNQQMINHPDPEHAGIDEALPSQLIRSKPEFGPYWRLMDEADLQNLAASPLVTIGSHGLSHGSFITMSRSRAKDEMSRSKSWLEMIIGRTVEAIAFPFGHYTRDTLDDAESLGYTNQLAVEFAHAADNSDPRVEERLGINPFVGWNFQLAAILKGRY